MYSRTPKGNRASLILRIICGVFFAAFSFVYLYCLQGDLLAYAQYVYSKGVTSYSLIIGASVITFLLLTIQWVVTRIAHFGIHWYALSYFVPALLLSVLTSVNPHVIKAFSFGNWTWILPLLLVAYVVLVKFLSQRETVRYGRQEYSVATTLWTNGAILLALFLMIGSTGTSNDVLLYELKTERLITEGRYADAVRVGEKSLASSERLSQLRMYALARQGELGERIFDFPQYYGVDGLLDVADTSSLYYRIDADDVCRYLGVVRVAGSNCRCLSGRYLNVAEAHLAQCADTLHQLCGHKRRLEDYMLAYSLLDKDMPTFQARLKQSARTSLPRAYREALLTLQTVTDSVPAVVMDEGLLAMVDSLTVGRYAEYNAMKSELTDSVERKNRLRRKFGNTYWWYYEYAE